MDEINGIFELLSEYGVMKLIITGGEPTLRKDLTKIIKKASRKFKLVTVISNGYFITDDFVNNIGEYKNVNISD
ncbi:radical SAM protein [Anaerocellum danielii]|uniref:Radical SAM protein n=1 Tax=Anaerocellum danielii TaxID=1387557 RepID=A0ABZ0U6Z6_9FIRM|nr:radical SAM protein [Caldicellulosiruptor danielii]WPX09530.1 radical SAM protein [Caldicellulosiruptor danielii]